MIWAPPEGRRNRTVSIKVKQVETLAELQKEEESGSSQTVRLPKHKEVIQRRAPGSHGWIARPPHHGSWGEENLEVMLMSCNIMT